MSDARDGWVDESVQQTHGGHFYVLAAALADSEGCEPVRDALRALLPAKARRLHWRAETERQHIKIVETIAAATAAGSGLSGLVIVGAPVNPRRQERARRLCLERLLFELGLLGIKQVWAEARAPTLNRRDLSLVAALRKTGTVPHSLSYDFAKPAGAEAEPMLWIPDAVAGVVGTARKTGDRTLRDILGNTITEINLTLT
ncbi:MAG: hypothetical protein FWD74_00975 [Actinomycetia bacterium]|nr:hypothetical protein [Actinomycetes bacterium]